MKCATIASINNTPFSKGIFICSISFYRKPYKKHDFLIKKGYDVNHCYFVLSGLLKLVYDEKEDTKHIISFDMEEWQERDFEVEILE